MAWAAARSKAVVLLLLIYCLIYFPLFVGVLCLSLFCYTLLSVHSSFSINEEEEKAGCFASIVLQMYCIYKCYVALPRLQYVIVLFPDHTNLLLVSVYPNVHHP